MYDESLLSRVCRDSVPPSEREALFTWSRESTVRRCGRRASRSSDRAAGSPDDPNHPTRHPGVPDSRIAEKRTPSPERTRRIEVKLRRKDVNHARNLGPKGHTKALTA